MLHDGDGVDRFRADRILAVIGLQVKLRKSIEPDSAGECFVKVDANEQSKPVYFSPCRFLGGKVAQKAYGYTVLYPFALCRIHPVTQHPRISALAGHGFE